jgi:hypothetical protein
MQARGWITQGYSLDKQQYLPILFTEAWINYLLPFADNYPLTLCNEAWIKYLLVLFTEPG